MYLYDPQINRVVGSFTGQNMGPPDVLQETTGCTNPTSGAPEEATCQPFEPRALISNGQERITRRAQVVHTGHVRREVCKRAGSPDPHHRTRPERSVPYPESTTNAQGHQTQTTGRALSVRCSQSESPAKVSQHRTCQQGLTSVRCLTLTEPGTNSTPDVQAHRPVPPRPASGALPQLLQTSHRHNRKYALHFLKSVESRRASSAGGRGTQTPLYPSTSTSFSKCANTIKCVPTSARVLAFSQSFSLKELS